MEQVVMKNPVELLTDKTLVRLVQEVQALGRVCIDMQETKRRLWGDGDGLRGLNDQLNQLEKEMVVSPDEPSPETVQRWMQLKRRVLTTMKDIDAIDWPHRAALHDYAKARIAVDEHMKRYTPDLCH